MKTAEIKLPGVAEQSYDVRIGPGSLASAGRWARRCLGKATERVCVISNPTVFALYGERLRKSLESSGFKASLFLIGDGEKFKNIATVEGVLDALSADGVTRTDAVVALGGGVVGDVAGLCAAVHLRGIRFLQIPTTLLAMVDSSVGGKTGVNSTAGKNIIGAFHHPSGVLIDPGVLTTLPERELTAGFCEMVKHATLESKESLAKIDSFLRSRPPNFSNSWSELSDLILENIRFKAGIVAGDERESFRKNDARSRKILNLGHTLAHSLEKITDYLELRHGEAVGYGLLFAAELSKNLDLLDNNSVKLLNDVVHRAGPLPALAHVDIQEVLEAFRFDKKQVSGSLQFVLLRGIGKPVIVGRDRIPLTAIKRALRTVLR